MLNIDLTTKQLIASQRNNLVIGLMNNGRETLTNIVFGLKLPATFTVIMGLKRVEIPRLTPNETFRHTLVVIPKSKEPGAITLYNLSYRDGSGRTQRLEDFSENITVLRALSPPETVKIKSEKENQKRSINRGQLMATLNQLVPQQFNQLLFEIKPPPGIIPPDTASQAARVYSLLTWAESPTGIGLNGVQVALDAFLQSVREKPIGDRFPQR